MSLYEKIYHDITIQNRYHTIGTYEDQTGGWAYHNWAHVVNVTQAVEKILTQLHVSDSYLEAAKIAAILHDTGAIDGKKGHAERGKLFAENYFNEQHLSHPYQQEIFSAIANHSGGFDTDDLMTLVLIFSDKLDITASRVAKEGLRVIGMRQLQHITQVDFELTKTNLVVRFTAMPIIDVTELTQFYFMKKVFKAIHAFATKLQLSPNVQLNGVSWEAFR